MRYRPSRLISTAAAAAVVLLAGWHGSAPPPAVASTIADSSGGGQPPALSTDSLGPSCLTTHGEPAPCCFTHRGYAGVCVVEPATDETCATILRYLNNPQAQGKTYCDSTNLRGGWKRVACEGPTTTD
jgi:hypothetical protein